MPFEGRGEDSPFARGARGADMGDAAQGHGRRTIDGHPAPQPARVPFMRLPPNRAGRDFLVGDIHGCFDLVLREMERARFDPAADRIVAVGDLVNRGPQSHRALRFLSYDWVSCVRGNHEDLVMRLHAEGDLPPATVSFLVREHGLGWWFRTPEALRDDLAEAFAKLPIAIELETDDGPLGIVHADVPEPLSWGAFLASLEAGDLSVMREALWGRSRIRGRRCEGVEGIPRIAVGHCDLPDGVTRFGNVYGIDTGAVFGAGGHGFLTFAEPSTLDDNVPGPDGPGTGGPGTP